METKITIFHNPKCSKSREALDLIQKSEHEIEIVSYLKEIPSKKQIQLLLKKLAIKPIDLFRKNEPEYLELIEGKTFTDEQYVDFLHIYPKLIERPIIIKGNKAIIGRPVSRVVQFLENKSR